jgi:hypothetical protein
LLLSRIYGDNAPACAARSPIFAFLFAPCRNGLTRHHYDLSRSRLTSPSAARHKHAVPDPHVGARDFLCLLDAGLPRRQTTIDCPFVCRNDDGRACISSDCYLPGRLIRSRHFAYQVLLRLRNSGH